MSYLKVLVVILIMKQKLIFLKARGEKQPRHKAIAKTLQKRLNFGLKDVLDSSETEFTKTFF